MTRRKRGGYIFVSYAGDHLPHHVHIYDGANRLVGRWDIENQRLMEGVMPSKAIRNALAQLGYLLEGYEGEPRG